MTEDMLFALTEDEMNAIANQPNPQLEGHKKSKKTVNQSKIMKNYWNSPKGKARRKKMSENDK